MVAQRAPPMPPTTIGSLFHRSSSLLHCVRSTCCNESVMLVCCLVSADRLRCRQMRRGSHAVHCSILAKIRL